MSHSMFRTCWAAACWAMVASSISAQAVDQATANQRVQAVIDEVDKTCREKTVYMIGPEKAKRLASGVLLGNAPEVKTLGR